MRYILSYASGLFTKLRIAMITHKKIISFLSLFLMLIGSLSAKQIYVQQDQPYALATAQNLPNYGTLKKNAKGLVYLDVANEFIGSIANKLDLPGQIVSPSINPGAIGAHIPVFLESENIHPDELGTKIPFEVLAIRSAVIKTNNGLIKPWEINIHSFSLENLRQKYGCSPVPKDDFYIRIGRQLPAAAEGSENIDTLSSYNFSDEPAQPLAEKGDFVTVLKEDMLSTAIKVNAVGKLCIKKNGFTYVDIGNEYIESIVPLLPTKGEFKPLDTNPKALGAHVSVFYEDELISREIWTLEEAGEWFYLDIKELRYVDRKTPSGKQRLWLMAVHAPAIQRLRKHYGLKPKLQGHDFHITIGTEKLDIPCPSPVLKKLEIKEIPEELNAA